MSRIVVHDYTGHPFQIQLSRELARRGHDVLHAFSVDFQTPKGDLAKRPDDPATLEIVPITLGRPFAKQREPEAPVSGAELRQARDLRVRTAQAGRCDFCQHAHRGPVVHPAAHAGSGAAFVFWMQDIYSIAVERLLTKRSRVLGTIVGWRYRQIEKASLKASEATVIISPDFEAVLTGWGVERSRVTTIPNWAPLGEITARQKDNAWARAHGFADRRCFVYSGTLGLKHQPHLLSELAKAVCPLPVVVVSEGIGADWLAVEKARSGLENLVLLPFQPYHVMSDVFGSADVLIALLERDAGIFSVPSKILSYMCAERALLAAVPNENLSARIVAGSGAGIVVEPDDTVGFLTSARQLIDDDSRRNQHARSARAYARQHFAIEAIADGFENVVVGALGRRGRN